MKAKSYVLTIKGMPVAVYTNERTAKIKAGIVKQQYGIKVEVSEYIMLNSHKHIDKLIELLETTETEEPEKEVMDCPAPYESTEEEWVVTDE